MIRLSFALLTAATLASCAHRPAVEPHSAPSAGESVGELPEAAPSHADLGDRAVTGSASRVVLGGRRDRVIELVRRYVQAVATRDLVTLAALFDQVVIDPVTGTPRTRDEVIAEQDRWLNAMDPSAIATVAAMLRPMVRSAANQRASGHPIAPAAQPGDWVVENPTRAANQYLAGIPHIMIVRWSGESPLIAGVARPSRMP